MATMTSTFVRLCVGSALVACGDQSTQTNPDAAPVADARADAAAPATDADADAPVDGPAGDPGPQGSCSGLGAGYTCAYSSCTTEGYSVINLGVLAGDGASTATAIDDSGNVSGTFRPYEGGNAFRWNARDGLAHLDTLGGRDSFGYGVGVGRVVGASGLASGGSHAFLSDDQGTHDLGTLGGASSFAYGINAAGIAVGAAQQPDGLWRPVRYQDGVATPIGTSGSALAINASGGIVGDSATANGDSHATKWVDGETIDLGTIGVAQSVAYAVNANGDAAGQLYLERSSQPARFAGGAVLGLGLPPHFRDGTATGINDAGLIVGTLIGQSTEVRIEHGFVFDGTSEINLNDLNNRDANGGRWQISQANAINNLGQIAGQGNGVSGKQAVLLTPHCVPTPPLRSLSIADGTMVDAPAGVAAGDFLLAAFIYHGDPQTLKTPAGWTLVVDQPAGIGTDQAFHAIVYTHIATASEPAQYKFSAPQVAELAVHIIDYRGLSEVDAVASTTLQGEPIGEWISAPNVTTSRNNVVLLGMFFDSAGGTWSKSLGMIGQLTVRSNAHGISLQDELRVAAGPTSDRSAQSTRGALAAISIALR